jgi:hypothetical protein
MKLTDIKREIKFFWQRLTRGFDDSVTWNLDITVAKFMLPRFKLYREAHNHIWYDPKYSNEEVFASRSQEDQKIFDQEGEQYTKYVLDEIEWFLEETIKCGPNEESWVNGDFDKEAFDRYNERYEKACVLFGTHFRRLWT